MRRKHTTCGGFSLIELVIVVVIIGILAAIAIPRLSRGTAGAADSALAGDLAVLRKALDLYAAEHNGTYPAVSTFSAQLTQYSDISGTTSATKTSTCIYGPYVRAVPALKVGPTSYKGSTTIIDGSTATLGATAGAWFYTASTGEIKANLTNTYVDAAGTAYNTY
ncbi:MAG: prepilin-type N-terminal cleavage/methylation domain-containing protein [Tepidisphaeraceae bacterium]